jgi:hypothetical protein
MSPDWVAQQIVKQAKADARNIIVTINPLTLILFPVKEFFVSLYFKMFSRQVISESKEAMTPEKYTVGTKIN